MVDLAAIALMATEVGKGPVGPKELGNPSFFIVFFLIPLMVLCSTAFLVYILLVFVKATRIRFLDRGVRLSAPGLLYEAFRPYPPAAGPSPPLLGDTGSP